MLEGHPHDPGGVLGLAKPSLFFSARQKKTNEIERHGRLEPNVGDG